jgi:hypothetical protein
MRSLTKTSFQAVSYDCAQQLLKRPDYLLLKDSDLADNLDSHDNYGINFISFARRIAKILSLKFGKKFSCTAGVDANTLAQCVWFLYFTELCNLLPTRVAVRNLKSRLFGKKILIPLKKLEIIALQEWKQDSDMLPLYRYWELAKNGLDPILVMPNGESVSNISVTINDNIIAASIFFIGDRLFIPKAVRGGQQIIDLIANDSPPKTKIQKLDFNGSLIKKNKTLISFERSTATEDELHDGFFMSTKSQDEYVSSFTSNLLSFLGTTNILTKQIVEKLQIKQANICDHLFVDTALFAGAVRESLGTVKLWPHSITTILAMHLNFPPDEMNRIYTDKHAIKLAQAGVKINLRPSLMLSPPRAFQGFNPNSKINVILIAGAHKLNQAPIFPIKAHKKTIQKLLIGLNERRDIIDFHIRPKGGWESLSFFQDLTKIKLKETPYSPSEINLPNMVFLCVTQSSAAILEGVSRGIPGLIVKDKETLDYLELDQRFFTSMGVTETLMILDTFCEPKKFEAFWERQRHWFNNYTNFA